MSAAVTVVGVSLSAAVTVVMSSSAPSPPGVSRGGTVSHYWQDCPILLACHYLDAGELEVDEAVHGGGAVVGEVVMGLEGGWLFAPLSHNPRASRHCMAECHPLILLIL